MRIHTYMYVPTCLLWVHVRMCVFLCGCTSGVCIVHVCTCDMNICAVFAELCVYVHVYVYVYENIDRGLRSL